MNLRRTACLFFLLWMICVNVAHALQEKNLLPADSSYTQAFTKNLATHEFSIWGGYAYDSYRFWGKTPDATVQNLGFRYNRALLNFSRHRLEYNLQMSLFSKYSYPDADRQRISLSGFGFSPTGFQLNFYRDKSIQPFINSSGGVMLLEGPFPDERGKKLNFTFGAGGGLEFLITSRLSFSVGVKYHHLSNFYRGEVNPGIDSNLFYTAITFF